jgi:hypothetical protein
MWLAFTGKHSACHTPLCLHRCRFLVMRMQGRDVPKGISMAQTLLALATQARAQGAFKLARYAYSKLQVRLEYSSAWHGLSRNHDAVRMWGIHGTHVHAWEGLQYTSCASSDCFSCAAGCVATFLRVFCRRWRWHLLLQPRWTWPPWCCVRIPSQTQTRCCPSATGARQQMRCSTRR